MRSVILAAFTAAAASCDGGPLFEKTNADPHPPQLLNLTVSPTVINPGDKIGGSFTYTDDGADIVEFRLRDTQSALALTPTLPPVTEIGAEGEEIITEGLPLVLLGTVGTTEWTVVFEPNQQGVHLLKAWLVDGKGSRSNTVEFEVTVNPFGGPL